MVTIKEYGAYLRVKRFIDGHDESEIISRLMGDNKYVSLIIKSDDADPIKYYSTSAAAKHWGSVIFYWERALENWGDQVFF